MENIFSFRFGKDGYGSVLLLLIMALTVISCSKSDDIPETIIPDVYVAGYFMNPGFHAFLWKNDEATLLNEGGGDESMALDVFVSGKDVYVAGYIKYGNLRQPTLWKNGTNITLSDNGSVATAVFVSGKDVYVSGYVINLQDTTYTPKLWKNGEEFDLPIEGYLGRANDVFVKGNDVYVCGWSNWDKSHPSNVYVKRAVLWKNGEYNVLSGIARTADATSVYVSENDVYVTGYMQDAYSNAFYATLWKNDQTEYLTPKQLGVPVAFGSFVSGNDVYVAGYDDNGSSLQPTLWKNSSAIRLPTGGKITVDARDVYVYEGVPYVTGTLQQQTGGIISPTLWIGDELTLLSNENGFATAVFVTKRN